MINGHQLERELRKRINERVLEVMQNTFVKSESTFEQFQENRGRVRGLLEVISMLEDLDEESNTNRTKDEDDASS